MFCFGINSNVCVTVLLLPSAASAHNKTKVKLHKTPLDYKHETSILHQRLFSEQYFTQNMRLLLVLDMSVSLFCAQSKKKVPRYIKMAKPPIFFYHQKNKTVRGAAAAAKYRYTFMQCTLISIFMFECGPDPCINA